MSKCVFWSSSNEINCDNDKQEMDIKINYLNSKKQQHKRQKQQQQGKKQTLVLNFRINWTLKPVVDLYNDQWPLNTMGKQMRLIYYLMKKEMCTFTFTTALSLAVTTKHWCPCTEVISFAFIFESLLCWKQH